MDNLHLPIKIKLPESFFFPEVKCNYNVSVESKQLWAVLLDLLCEFDRVCKKCGIKYSLDSGTLLGAIRHKGFIPWDDDIDVIMLRSEYDKLCNIAINEFKYPYFFQNNDTDPGSLRRHAQLRNSETTCILHDETKDEHPMYTFNQGVFMDIFILDEIPDNPEELATMRVELTKHISILWELKHLYYSNDCNPWILDALNKEMHCFDTIVSQYNGHGNRRVANFSLEPNRKDTTLFEKTTMEDLVYYDFECFRFPGPRDYDAVLTGFYNNWKEFVVGYNLHGQLFIDLYSSYKHYLEDKFQFSSAEIHPLTEIIMQRNDLRQECSDIKQTLYKAREDYEDANTKIQKDHENIESLTKELEESKIKCAILEREQPDIFNIYSWRFTRLFRKIEVFFRKCHIVCKVINDVIQRKPHSLT